LIFSFHYSQNEGWIAVGEAIFNAGLGVAVVHPIKAEMSGSAPKSQTKAPINYDAILICKRQVETVPASLEDAVDRTINRAKEKLLVLQRANKSSQLSAGDIFVVTQSEALCVFSQHVGKLRDSSHSIVTLSEFLAATSSRLTMVSAYNVEVVEIEQILA
jgi:putative DNA methylase